MRDLEVARRHEARVLANEKLRNQRKGMKAKAK